MSLLSPTIYTNAGNPLGLKLIICSRLQEDAKKVTPVVVYPSLAESPLSHLPSLVVNERETLFASNSAAKFLFPVMQLDDQYAVDQWLEWSLLRLAPAILQSGRDPKARQVLQQALTNLNTALGATGKFLTGRHVNCADIGIWSLIALEETLKGAKDVDHIKAWFQRVLDIPAVKSVIEKYPLSDLSLAALQQCNSFGGFSHIKLDLNGSPSHSADKNQADSAWSDMVTTEELQLVYDNFVYKKHIEEKEPRTILPIPGRKNVLITSALPYVNNVPHLGNIIGCVLSADIFARFSRMTGTNTLFICGTDEYGTATEAKALAENLTPQQICDKYFEMHNNVYRWFGIGFDYFGRTSTPEQKTITQEMFLDLHRNGFMDEESVDQLLCTKCNRFLADRFVEGLCPHEGCGYEDARGDQCDSCGKLVNATELGNPRCSVCRSKPELVKSNQFFINLPKIEPELRKWIATVDQDWSNNARVITRAWLKEGLRPRCITRDLKWGIQVPYKGYESKVFYVWFDAPIGYLSITARYTKEWKQWWAPKDKDVKVDLYQFMAKDNVPFHSVFFPSMLIGLGQGHTKVSHLMATEYLNYEDGKFSKSRGIGVFGTDAQETGIPADVWRFYLAATRPEGQDSNFSWNDLVLRNNSELLNNLGNFINRALVFAEKNFGGLVPAINLGTDELLLFALVNRELENYVQTMAISRFRDGVRSMLTVSRLGNQYLQTQQPWVLLKGTDDQKERAATVIGVSCNLCCVLATLLFPFMPETSRTIQKQLNIHLWKLDPENPFVSRCFEPGHVLGKPFPLFAKIEQTRLDELKAKYGGQQQQSKPAATPVPVLATAAEAAKAVDEQAIKVRDLKLTGVEKSVWQPEVDLLLKLKKQLANLTNPTTVAAPVDAKQVEAAVAEQAEKVRKLKTSGAEKAVWQPEVERLLSLKKELAQLSGVEATPAAPSKRASKKK